MIFTTHFQFLFYNSPRKTGKDRRLAIFWNVAHFLFDRKSMSFALIVSKTLPVLLRWTDGGIEVNAVRMTVCVNSSCRIVSMSSSSRRSSMNGTIVIGLQWLEGQSNSDWGNDPGEVIGLSCPCNYIFFLSNGDIVYVMNSPNISSACMDVACSWNGKKCSSLLYPTGNESLIPIASMVLPMCGVLLHSDNSHSSCPEVIF